MPKRTLLERMEKKGVPKTWLAEINILYAQIKALSRKIVEYGRIIDQLAREKENRMPETYDRVLNERDGAVARINILQKELRTAYASEDSAVYQVKRAVSMLETIKTHDYDPRRVATSVRAQLKQYLENIDAIAAPSEHLK